MPKNDASKVISGTYGTIWVDGELWAEVDSFEAKVTIKYEDVNFANDGATHKKGNGWIGEGSLTLKKVYSRVQRKIAVAVKNGKYPRSQIVGKLADPDAHGTERAVINDVTFNEFNLLKFDQKSLGSEEIPFAFSDFDLPDLIAN